MSNRSMRHWIGTTRVLAAFAWAACVVMAGSIGCAELRRADGDAGADHSDEAQDSAAAPDGSIDGTRADTNTPNAEVSLSFGGACKPELESVVVATTRDSIGLANAQRPNDGSLVVQLPSGVGELTLSTKGRSTSGDIVNLIAGGLTYTNLCKSGPGGCSYDTASETWNDDPIGGTIEVAVFEPEKGRLDMTLTNVRLQSFTTGDLCTIDGTVRTHRAGK